VESSDSIFPLIDNTNGPRSPTTLDMNLNRLKPDVYFSLIDIWFTGHMVKSCNRMNIPHVSYLPIDGYPFSRLWKDVIKHTHTPLWMAHYGRQQFEEFIETYKSGGTGMEHLRDPFLDRYDGIQTPLLYHGVDLDLYKPISDEMKKVYRESLGIGRWETVFVSVGRNTNRKQQPRLLHAFKRMLEMHPNPASVGMVLHVGDPTDTMGMGGWNLPEMVHELGLSNNVTFSDANTNPLHGLSREDLAKLYQLGDCHILATGGEGFGVPSAEAMACGLPIILPDNSTGPELVDCKAGLKYNSKKDGKNGILVSVDTGIVGPKWGVTMGLVNIERLAEAMFEMAIDVDKRKKMGKNARKFAEKNFDWDKLADELEEILYTAYETPHPLGNNSVIQ
jgi:D-inositol-3-phosphate glycosyltransferase